MSSGTGSAGTGSAGTKLIGNRLSMGTKFFGTICPGRPNGLGTVCPGGPIFWDPLSRVTGSGGQEVRGSNGFWTNCVAAVAQTKTN